MNLDRHNLGEIEQFNQQGGRTLSIVDLIQASAASRQRTWVAELVRVRKSPKSHDFGYPKTKRW